MKILIAYGSKMGGTAGLAEMLGTELRALGHHVDVEPAAGVDHVNGYHAVIVGGALYYFFSWHRDARRFLKRHRSELKQRAVWLFSSGPLDQSAREETIPPVRYVRRALESLGGLGHMTFGGRLEEPNGKLPTGDWRDPTHVREWAEAISAGLETA